MFEGTENEAVYLAYNFSLIETDYTLPDVAVNGLNFPARTDVCLKLDSVPVLNILNFDFFELIALYGDFLQHLVFYI